MRQVVSISLPEKLRASVDQLVASDGYANVSEYVRELIREDLRRREREWLNRQILEALEAVDRGEYEVIKDLDTWAVETKKKLGYE